MSTDYDVVCHTCRARAHLGQRFTTGWSFGYGTGDVEAARRCGEFILEHVEHGLVITESGINETELGYRYVRTER